MMWSLWWVWMVGALALAFLEVLVSGWIFLGFAIGAAVTGLLFAVAWTHRGLAGWLIASDACGVLGSIIDRLDRVAPGRRCSRGAGQGLGQGHQRKLMGDRTAISHG